jgi:hypothetical protein
MAEHVLSQLLLLSGTQDPSASQVPSQLKASQSAQQNEPSCSSAPQQRRPSWHSIVLPAWLHRRLARVMQIP